MTREYKPIPSEHAKDLAENYDKDMVVILGWDLENNKIHTATYGTDDDKRMEADAYGELATALLGGDISKMETFQDFRGEWLVWSNEHGAYWGPNHRGYVMDREQAGRYSFRDACAIVEGANKHKSPKEPPFEAMIRA